MNQDSDSGDKPGNRGKVARITAIALIVIFIAVFIYKRAFFQVLFLNSLNWMQDLGPLGPVVFTVIYVLATVLSLPGSILTLGAGFVYGLIKGFVIVSVASTLGATCAFLVGRYLTRDWVARKVEGHQKFKSIDEAVGEAGWKIVGLTRLSPVFPFNMLNYAYGLTKVSLRDYFFASWIGMMPGTVMYVYFGSLAGSLATLGTDQGGQTPAQLAVKVVGLIATVMVTVYITRIAKKALSTRVEGLKTENSSLDQGNRGSSDE